MLGPWAAGAGRSAAPQDHSGAIEASRLTQRKAGPRSVAGRTLRAKVDRMHARRRPEVWAARLAGAAFAVWLGACATPAADDSQPPLPPAVARLYETLAGTWRGHLDYRDASGVPRRVPTTLVVSRVIGTDALRFDYEYFGGGGSSTRSADRGRIDLDQRIYTVQSADGAEASTYQIASARRNEQPYSEQLVLLASGLDNGTRVESRITITVTEKSLRVLREARPIHPPAAAWQFRHEYALARP